MKNIKEGQMRKRCRWEGGWAQEGVGTSWDGLGRDGTGWDGLGRAGTRWDALGRDGNTHRVTNNRAEATEQRSPPASPPHLPVPRMAENEMPSCFLLSLPLHYSLYDSFERHQIYSNKNGALL